MGKRGKGQGSLYRRKDGLWVGQYVGHTLDRAKKRYIYPRPGKKRLRSCESHSREGLRRGVRPRVVEGGGVLSKWLDSVRGTVRERIWKRSEEIVRIHPVPALGKTRLDRMSTLQPQALYSFKPDSGLSAGTVRMIHTILHKALKQAIRRALIPRNVIEAVDPPRERGTEILISAQTPKARILAALCNQG